MFKIKTQTIINNATIIGTLLSFETICSLLSDSQKPTTKKGRKNKVLGNAISSPLIEKPENKLINTEKIINICLCLIKKCGNKYTNNLHHTNAKRYHNV